MRFRLEKKLVAVVRYFETMYVIRDDAGERLYTGNDETTAKRILVMLNREAGRMGKPKRRKPKRRKRK